MQQGTLTMSYGAGESVSRGSLAGMRRGCTRRSVLTGLVLAALGAGRSPAGAARPPPPIRLAVATNFAEPAQALADAFAAETGRKVLISTGATGTLYAQINAGAPFDVLLAADAERPALLEASGRGVAGTRQTYAIGRLVLWSRKQAVLSSGDCAEILRTATFERLAMADPKLAPYGLAAQQALTRLGLWETLQSRLIFGANVGQAHAMVATGNAELGLVALSLAISARNGGGRHVVVPADLHEPIRQDMIALPGGHDGEAGRAFARFLKTAAARAIVERFGYEAAPA